jgi:polyisoprenoid-binding protein YceI
VRAGDSTVEYALTKWGVFREQGRFRRLSGTIAYDPMRPERSRVALRVPVESLDSGTPGRDATLLSADFFDAARFPEMVFVSSQVRFVDQDELLVTGVLTIRGQPRALEVPVRLLGRGRGGDGGGEELVAFEARFTVDRRDFGVLGAAWSGGRAILSDEVEIHLIVGGYGSPAGR